MSLSTSELQLQLSKQKSCLWTDEADNILTLLAWIGFDIQWEIDTLSDEPELLSWGFWHHQLKWFDSFLAQLSSFRPAERMHVPIVYPPVTSEEMVTHLATYRRVKDRRRIWNILDEPSPLAPHLQKKWERTQKVLGFFHWRDLAQILKSLKWLTLPTGQFEYQIPEKGHQSQYCTVKMDKKVQILSTPVTEWLWNAVMGLRTPRTNPNLPKGSVTWWDACVFCNRLSEILCLEPVYQYRHYNWLDRLLVLEVPDIPHFKWTENASGIRLPTEAEWVYMAGAGRHLLQHPESLLQKDIVPLQQWPKNKWGAVGARGPIHEWCWDTYAPDFWKEKSTQRNPRGSEYFDSRKVLVGHDPMVDQVSGGLKFEDLNSKSERIGFRIARMAD